MLSYLVYISVRKPNCTDTEIEKILASCNRNNGKFDITGVLLYSDKQFVQYLEGEYAEIFELYDKIKQDNRHKNIVLITSGNMEERSFPSWQMGAKKVDFNNIEYKTQMSKEEQAEFNNILSGRESNKALSIMQKLFK